MDKNDDVVFSVGEFVQFPWLSLRFLVFRFSVWKTVLVEFLRDSLLMTSMCTMLKYEHIGRVAVSVLCLQYYGVLATPVLHAKSDPHPSSSLTGDEISVEKLHHVAAQEFCAIKRIVCARTSRRRDGAKLFRRLVNGSAGGTNPRVRRFVCMKIHKNWV